MVMNSPCSMSVCMPDVHEQIAKEQESAGPVVIGDEGTAADFDSALGRPGQGPQGEHTGSCDFPPATESDPISETGPVTDTDGVTTGVPGSDQSPRVSDLDVDALLNTVTNLAFQSADPQMQRMALNAALNHEDPNTALNALNNLVQSDLFQGQGLEGVLSDQEMGSLRSVLLGMYGMFANLQSRQGGAGMTPGMDGPVVGGPVTGQPMAPTVPAQPAPQPVNDTPNAENNPRQGGNGGSSDGSAQNGPVENGPVVSGPVNGNTDNRCGTHVPNNDNVDGNGMNNSGFNNNGAGSNPAFGEAGVGSPAASNGAAPFSATGGFGQFRQILQSILQKLGMSDQQNGTNHTQDFINMFIETLTGLAGDFGADGAEDIIGALGDMPTVGAPTSGANTQVDTDANRAGHAEQAFMSAFSQVL